MPAPDIIIPLTEEQDGPTAHVWIESVEITRQGQEITPGMSDRWKIALPLRASLGIGDQIVLDTNGREIPTTVPLASAAIDVARLVHHPEVAALLMQLRDVTIRIATGDLAPSQQESTP